MVFGRGAGRAYPRYSRSIRPARLAPGWSADDAADWIWARIQPSAYAQLVEERGWSHRRVTERTVTSLLRELVAPAG